jgi:hypothetical protein
MTIGMGLVVPVCSPLTYQAVAGSQSSVQLGTVGKIGDYLHGVRIVPAAATGVGNVSITDGAGSPITIFVGGTLADTKSFFLPITARSTGQGWKVTTGASVSVIAVGDFT